MCDSFGFYLFKIIVVGFCDRKKQFKPNVDNVFKYSSNISHFLNIRIYRMWFNIVCDGTSDELCNGLSHVNKKADPEQLDLQFWDDKQVAMPSLCQSTPRGFIDRELEGHCTYDDPPPLRSSALKSITLPIRLLLSLGIYRMA